MALALSHILPASARLTAVGEEVYRGLTARPKMLSPWLFYDSEGSRLFEQITLLPEYYVTRTERAIFARHADAILALASCGERLAVLELGAGTAAKTGLLLAAAVRLQRSLDYYPIDVSASALEQAKAHLEQEIPGVRVHPRVADYTAGLGALETDSSDADPSENGRTKRLVLYIGSSIGNFAPEDAQSLLADVRSQLAPGDCLLLGADQVKAESLLHAAYDDAAGVTAAFNRNVLTRINRELGAEFRPETFAHRALWNERQSRIEMHLESRIAQRVNIPALGIDLRFARGETIHTENSYKFTDAQIDVLLAGAGFHLSHTWKDARNWFGVYLAEAL